MNSDRIKKFAFSLFDLIPVILCIILFSGAQTLFAQTESTTLENTFRKANELYAAGNYTEAAKKYSELIKASGASGELYYNLGCAYFKDGKPGYALSSFMKAARLDPRDPDIRKNIEFVKAVTSPVDDAIEDGSSVLMQKIDEILFFFSDFEIGITQIALLILSFRACYPTDYRPVAPFQEYCCRWHPDSVFSFDCQQRFSCRSCL